MCWFSVLLKYRKRIYRVFFGSNIYFLYEGRTFDQIASRKKIGLYYFFYEFFPFSDKFNTVTNVLYFPFFLTNFFYKIYINIVFLPLLYTKFLKMQKPAINIVFFSIFIFFCFSYHLFVGLHPLLM